MSDEYANSGLKGSLVNKSADQPELNTDAATGNYPPPGDTTSSGGYSSSTSAYSPSAQRGRINVDLDASNTGLVQQSLSGANLQDEIGDAKQGVDPDTRRDARAEETRGVGERQYDESLEGRKQAEEALKEKFKSD